MGFDPQNPNACGPLQSQFTEVRQARDLTQPFGEVCLSIEGVASLIGRPTVSSMSIPTKHGDTVSLNFLGSIAEAAREHSEAQEGAMLEAILCVKNPKRRNCAQIRKTLLEAVPECAAEARRNLYLGFERTYQPGNFDFGSLGPNNEMNIYDTSKAVPWANPKGAELEKLKREWKRMFNSVDKFAREQRAADSTVSVDAARRDHLKYFRGAGDEDKDLIDVKRGICGSITETSSGTAGHMRNYRDIMETWPILSYIQSPNPDEKEILRALMALKDNARKEKERHASLLAKVDRDYESKTVDPELLSLLDDQYAPLIHERLSKNPEYCGLAASLSDAMYSRMERDTYATIGAGAALMFFPPAWAFAGGAILTGAVYYNSQNEVTGLRQKGRMAIQSSESRFYVSQEVLTDAEFNKNLEAVLSPLSIFGGKAFIRGVRSSRFLRPRVR